MFTKETYINRREKLFQTITNGIGLFITNPESPMNCAANCMQYRQDSSFYYFFGLNLPKYIGAIDFETKEVTLFGNDFDIADIIWMGEQDSIVKIAETIGVKNTKDYNDIYDYIKNSNKKIHFLSQYMSDNKVLLSNLLNQNVNEVNKSFSVEFTKAVIDIRSIKEDQEIAEIESCGDICYEIHTTAMKMAKGGETEQFIAGTLEAIPYKYGGRLSFPLILSQNGQTLHNHNHSLTCEEGRLLLCDAGAENSNLYATDNTRTIPVGGKFSDRQKQIYNIVLEANIEAIKLIKPDVIYRDIHLETARIIFRGLKKLNLVKGDVDKAVELGVHALFYPHGLGHMMGLDVHDMEDLNEDLVGYDSEIKRSSQFGLAYLRLGRRLQTNFVITVEPGIYFIPALINKWKEENKFQEFLNFDEIEKYKDFGGIRIEDDILVTENGCRVLGKPIPKTVNEIEDFMRNN